MKKIIHYCDFCGKETANLKNLDTRLRFLNSHWYVYFGPLYDILTQKETLQLQGDCCKECFISYKNWCKSRRS